MVGQIFEGLDAAIERVVGRFDHRSNIIELAFHRRFDAIDSLVNQVHTFSHGLDLRLQSLGDDVEVTSRFRGGALDAFLQVLVH